MKIPLTQNEKVIITLRAFLPRAWAIFFATFFIAAPFFFMFWLFRHTPWGTYVFGASLALGAALWVRAIYMWRMNMTIFTTDRIIDVEQKGFFNRETHEIGWNTVEAVGSVRKGLWATVWRAGVITIETRNNEYDFESHPIRHPERAHTLIAEVFNIYMRTHKLDEEDTLRSVLRHIARLSDDELDTVETYIAKQREKLYSSSEE